jgi:hypothetical protein
MDRTALAEIIGSDLEQIIDKTRAAYLERLPRMRKMTGEHVDEVIAATRRTMKSFLRYYVEGSLDSSTWTAVRDATIDRAGELFSHEEILEIMSIARGIAADATHHLGDLHPELSAADRDELSATIDRYISEIALQEDKLRQLSAPDHLDDVLAALEAEGPDWE